SYSGLSSDGNTLVFHLRNEKNFDQNQLLVCDLLAKKQTVIDLPWQSLQPTRLAADGKSILLSGAEQTKPKATWQRGMYRLKEKKLTCELEAMTEEKYPTFFAAHLSANGKVANIDFLDKLFF